MKHELSFDELLDAMEDGYIIRDSKSQGYYVYQRHEKLFHCTSWNDTLKNITRHKNVNNYYPSVFYVNERGTIVMIGIRKRLGNKKFYSNLIQSWV